MIEVSNVGYQVKGELKGWAHNRVYGKPHFGSSRHDVALKGKWVAEWNTGCLQRRTHVQVAICEPTCTHPSNKNNYRGITFIISNTQKSNIHHFSISKCNLHIFLIHFSGFACLNYSSIIDLRNVLLWNIPVCKVSIYLERGSNS